jgi:pyruvyltransferase
MPAEGNPQNCSPNSPANRAWGSGGVRALYRCFKATVQAADSGLHSVIGGILGNGLNAYWWPQRNFGDLLTPFLLSAYGFTPVYSPPARAHLVSTGSLLEMIPQDYAGYIVGSGLMFGRPRPLPHARILSLRGAMTRDRVGAARDVLLGDPGLLACRLIKRRVPKGFTLGLVPHFVDSNDPRILSIERRYPGEVAVIDVKRSPAAVLADIDRCEFILSSSLHGLITADSLGIPNAWLWLSNRVKGGEFKFLDYASSLRVRREPCALSESARLADLVRLTQKPPAAVGELADRLHELFSSLPSLFESGAFTKSCLSSRSLESTEGL